MRLGIPLRSAALAAAFVPLVACSSGYSVYDIPGVTFQAPDSEGLESFAFMQGCWRGGQTDGPLSEEYFSIDGAGTMMGWSRTTRNGRLDGFEFIRIVREGADIVYEVWPDGVRSPARFVLTDIVDQAQATFEDPDHDFPRRIRYQLIQPDLLQITIDAGPSSEGDVIQMTMARVACETG